jgi:hypothetical protein
MDPTILAALAAAARATGADPALLLALAWKESRFDPKARNSGSSARGLMQFTRATWLEVVRDFGPRHGLARHAAALSTNPRDGSITTRDRRLLAEILALRDDPRLSAVMAAERITHERPGLAQALGRPAAAADLYVVHLLGPAGARNFLATLRQAPSRSAAGVVGRDSAGPNGGVFLAPGSGRAFSLREVYAAIEDLLAEQRKTRATLLAALDPALTGDAAGSTGPVELAEAR